MQQLRTRISGPVAVIGDVHGQVEKLLVILEKLQSLPDYELRHLVFLGDFVDRGPDPKGAVDVFCDLLTQHPRVTAVAGNHELAMAGALGLIPAPDYSNWAHRWVDHYDAHTTFESYGAEFGNLPDLYDRMDEKHRALLAELPWLVEHPQYLFVHAGLDPNTPFEIQLRILQQRDFSLNHPPWLCSKSVVASEVPGDCPLTVVSGHVRVPQVIFRHKRILLDTTGGATGDLSCVLLPEQQVITSGVDPRRQPAAAVQSRSWWKLW